MNIYEKHLQFQTNLSKLQAQHIKLEEDFQNISSNKKLPERKQKHFLKEKKIEQLQSYHMKLLEKEKRAKQRNMKLLEDFDHMKSLLKTMDLKTSKLKEAKMNCLKLVELHYPEWKQKLQIIRASKQLESNKVLSDQVETVKNIHALNNTKSKNSNFVTTVPSKNENSCISKDQFTSKTLMSTPDLKSEDTSAMQLVQLENVSNQNPNEIVSSGIKITKAIENNDEQLSSSIKRSDIQNEDKKTIPIENFEENSQQSKISAHDNLPSSNKNEDTFSKNSLPMIDKKNNEEILETETVNLCDSTKLENEIMTNYTTNLTLNPTIDCQQDKLHINNKELSVESDQIFDNSKVAVPSEYQKQKHSIVIPAVQESVLGSSLSETNTSSLLSLNNTQTPAVSPDATLDSKAAYQMFKSQMNGSAYENKIRISSDEDLSRCENMQDKNEDSSSNIGLRKLENKKTESLKSVTPISKHKNTQQNIRPVENNIRKSVPKAPWEDSSDEDLEVYSFTENNQSENDDDFYD